MAALWQDAAASRTILEVRGLGKRFGQVEVLKSIDLRMDAGDFLVLVGPSGCGKSTLLNCIAGLEEATSGAIVIGGRDVTQVPPRDRDIAMVFQSYALYPTMTVAENIAFGMRVRGIGKAEQEQKTRHVAALLKIDHLLDRKPAHLSGGQRQRVAMGRALVREPQLFLFDEPLSNLDAKLRVEMRAEIKRLHERLAASIVYVTHDQIEAMTLGTHIVVLKDGAVQQVGTPKEIYERPNNLFVADFMGSPPMNLLPGQLRFGASGAEVRLAGGGTLADPNPPAALRAYDGRDIIVGVRPEAFALAGAGDTALTAEPQLIEHAGSDIFATVTLAGKDAVVRLPGRSELVPGRPLALAVDMSSVCYFDPATELRIG